MVRLNINNEESGIAYLRYFISNVLIAIAIAVNNWATPGPRTKGRSVDTSIFLGFEGLKAVSSE